MIGANASSIGVVLQTEHLLGEAHKVTGAAWLHGATYATGLSPGTTLDMLSQKTVYVIKNG